jgi:hypothetical protein
MVINMIDTRLRMLPSPAFQNLTIFQAVTGQPQLPFSSSHENLMAHKSALLFLISDLFFVHFLRSKILCKDNIPGYTSLVYSMHPSYKNTEYAPIFTPELYAALDQLLQEKDTRMAFFIHIQPQLKQVIHDLSRLFQFSESERLSLGSELYQNSKPSLERWDAKSNNLTIFHLRELVELGIQVVFRLKSMEPRLIFFFPPANALADQTRMDGFETSQTVVGSQFLSRSNTLCTGQSFTPYTPGLSAISSVCSTPVITRPPSLARTASRMSWPVARPQTSLYSRKDDTLDSEPRKSEIEREFDSIVEEYRISLERHHRLPPDWSHSFQRSQTTLQKDSAVGNSAIPISSIPLNRRLGFRDISSDSYFSDSQSSHSLPRKKSPIKNIPFDHDESPKTTVGRARVLFTYWPGVLDRGQSRILTKASVWTK